MTRDELFTRVFLPLYPEDARRDLAAARSQDANPARNPQVTAHLGDAARIFVGMAPALLGADLNLDGSDASVHRLAAALTTERRDEWLAQGAEGTAENTLFNVVVHGAAYVGQCVVLSHGGVWAVRRPLWESQIELSSHAGRAFLPVFHWWLKSLTDPASTLADRYRTHVETPCRDALSLPILIPQDRRLPRLTKVRYDLLYKHLKAHAPEIRDFGEDFPSPARLDELQFRWLDFLVLGEGRMLLVYGHAARGLHLYWIDGSGFAKALYFPTDDGAEARVERQGDRLVVTHTYEGRTNQHEMLWWGW